MSENIPLSIVIPTRNRPERLRQLLGSLANEEGWDEAIIVEDGSDEPLEEEPVAEVRPIVMLQQESSGPAAARNRGWRRARGNAVLFLDDDVSPLPGAIARHARFHKDNRETHRVLIGRLAYPHSPEPTPFMLYLTESPYGPFNPIRAVPAGQEFRRLTTSAVSLKKSMLEALKGFDEAFSKAWGEDFDFARRLQEAGARFEADDSPTFTHHKSYDIEEYCDALRRNAPDSIRMERRRDPRWTPAWRDCRYDEELFRSLIGSIRKLEAEYRALDERVFGKIGIRNALWELYRTATAMAHNAAIVNGF